VSSLPSAPSRPSSSRQYLSSFQAARQASTWGREGFVDFPGVEVVELKPVALEYRSRRRARARGPFAPGSNHRRCGVAGARDREAVKRHALKPLGRIVDSQWAGLDPGANGPPGPCTRRLRYSSATGFELNDLDAWKSTKPSRPRCWLCLAAWKEDKYLPARSWAWTARWASSTRRNSTWTGGAIALGHPVGASGARIRAAPDPHAQARRQRRPKVAARHGLDLHRRGPRRRDAGRTL